MDEKIHQPKDDDNGADGGGRQNPEKMIDSLKVAAGDLAERAGPTVRELSARAAELTATAAVKAAPLARRAGEATAGASTKLAEWSRGWAADLRRDQADTAAAESPSVDAEPPSPAFEEGSGPGTDERETDPPTV